MSVLEWKERVFVEKVNSRWFCWFKTVIWVDKNGTPIWRLHPKLYKGAWNVSENNSEIVGHKNLRLGKIVYILVFYSISFPWLLPLDGFQFILLLRDSENIYSVIFNSRLNFRISAPIWKVKRVHFIDPLQSHQLSLPLFRGLIFDLHDFGLKLHFTFNSSLLSFSKTAGFAKPYRFWTVTIKAPIRTVALKKKVKISRLQIFTKCMVY